MGHKRWNDGYTLRNKRLFDISWLQGIFDRVFVTRSRVRATKCDPLARIWGVAKKRYGHNVQNICPTINHLLEDNSNFNIIEALNSCTSPDDRADNVDKKIKAPAITATTFLIVDRRVLYRCQRWPRILQIHLTHFKVRPFSPLLFACAWTKYMSYSIEHTHIYISFTR